MQKTQNTQRDVTQLFSKTVRTGFVACLAMLCFAFPAHSQVYVGGELTASETYSPGNNPYIVTQNLIVNKGITLTILPGVEMQFETATSLIVNGTLIASGTTSQGIKFIPKKQSPVPGQWNGLVFNNTKTLLNTDSTYVSGSVLSGAAIRSATYSVTLDQNTALLIENTQISNCSFGIYLKESGYNTIRNCNFTACDFGIFLASGFLNPENKIYGNSVSGSTDVGIFINSNNTQPNHNFISGNRITACNIGIHVGNYSNTGSGYNIISGNSFSGNKDAIKLFRHSNSISSNYFMFNRNGIICWQSDNNTIKNNLFSGNVMNAITLAAGSSYNSVSNNSLNFNYGGVLIKPDSSRSSLNNAFLYNTICRNTGFSFQLLNTPQGPMQFNNMIQNGDFQSFMNMSDSLIHGEYNFWGTTSGSIIDSILLDISDNPLYGEVLHMPVLDNILTSAPVPPPDRVIKQGIGNDMVVSWNAADLADFNGYNVYSGNNDGIVFEHKLNNGIKQMLNMGNISAEDTIAVTVFDLQADGSDDQTEGFESDYSYAILYPYAGPDTAICFNSEYFITEATSYNYENTIWGTSGDGTFNNPQSANTVYTPGGQDYINGFVYLFIDDAGFGLQHIDSALITFHDAPLVFAGNDTLITTDSAFRLDDATASGYDTVKWTTSGDGSFDSDSISNPSYTPGTNDWASGEIILTLVASSACGTAADQIQITIDPGYFIEGRVHAGSLPAPNSLINIYKEKDNNYEPVRSGLLAVDGNFKFTALTAGTFYLYAVPDKIISPGYIPTYYFNDIHWENAYKFELTANTYDVDIDLARIQLKLPDGEGSILGRCTSQPGGSGSCGEVTVFLYDSQMKNIFDWVQVHNGDDFRFRMLPFGSYILAGEKTGLPVFTSQVITLTPSQPLVENIELICMPAGYRFTMPPGFISGAGAGIPGVFPNPVTDVLTVSGLTEAGTYNILITNSQGYIEKNYTETGDFNNKLLFLRTLPSGLYIIEVRKDGVCLLRQKLIKH